MTRLIPLVFAALWSTGFIGAKFGLPFVGPYMFLFLRFSLTLVALGAIIFAMRIQIPRDWESWRDTWISGLLIHAAYLGGVFTAIKLGLPAGVTAIIVGIQPILTLLVTGSARDTRAVCVCLLGFFGLVLVVWDDGISVPVNLLFPAIVAALGITFGTLYQKRTLGHLPILSIALMQYVPTTLLFAGLAYIFEWDSPVIWTWQLVFSLAWLCFVLSIGAVLLMSIMYRTNSASKAANYFYAAPPLALIQGYFFFEETISTVNFAGIVLIVLGLYLLRYVSASVNHSKTNEREALR